jgi:hypothetical protein
MQVAKSLIKENNVRISINHPILSELLAQINNHFLQANLSIQLHSLRETVLPIPPLIADVARNCIKEFILLVGRLNRESIMVLALRMEVNNL